MKIILNLLFLAGAALSAYTLAWIGGIISKDWEYSGRLIIFIILSVALCLTYMHPAVSEIWPWKFTQGHL